jgi:hypothetical protein
MRSAPPSPGPAAGDQGARGARAWHAPNRHRCVHRVERPRARRRSLLLWRRGGVGHHDRLARAGRRYQRGGAGRSCGVCLRRKLGVGGGQRRGARCCPRRPLPSDGGQGSLHLTTGGVDRVRGGSATPAGTPELDACMHTQPAPLPVASGPGATPVAQPADTRPRVRQIIKLGDAHGRFLFILPREIAVFDVAHERILATTAVNVNSPLARGALVHTSSGGADCARACRCIAAARALVLMMTFPIRRHAAGGRTRGPQPLHLHLATGRAARAAAAHPTPRALARQRHCGARAPVDYGHGAALRHDNDGQGGGQRDTAVRIQPHRAQWASWEVAVGDKVAVGQSSWGEFVTQPAARSDHPSAQAFPAHAFAVLIRPCSVSSVSADGTVAVGTQFGSLQILRLRTVGQAPGGSASGALRVPPRAAILLTPRQTLFTRTSPSCAISSSATATLSRACAGWTSAAYVLLAVSR